MPITQRFKYQFKSTASGAASLTITPNASWWYDETYEGWKRNGTVDHPINISDATSIYVQFYGVTTTGNSASHDVNVITSWGSTHGGTPTYDDASNIYASKNFVSCDIGSFLVNPGPHLMKLRMDKNSTDKTLGTVLAFVNVKRSETR